jgi:hypothetical protein
MSDAERGWVYVITNEAMPGLVKVGQSSRDPLNRGKELDASTGLPYSYTPRYDALVIGAYRIEQLAHVELSPFHVNGEWFRCSVEVAVQAIRKMAGEALLYEGTTLGGIAEERESERQQANAETAAESDEESYRPRPGGTYNVICSRCGGGFSATLYWNDFEVRCPLCHELSDTTAISRKEFII